MADLVNFRRAKKAKARAEKEKKANENRVAFGTPKALKNLTQARREKAQRDVDAHKREKD